MTEYSLLTGVGKDRPGIVNDLTKSLSDLGCSLEESRMSVLGGEFAIIVLVSGSADVIRQLEKCADDLYDATGLNFRIKQTSRKTNHSNMLRYQVDVKSMDHSGIVHSVTDFFADKRINIESLSTETYAAAHSGTPMFSLSMVVEIPATTPIAQLRQTFIEFCDDQLLDASLEAV